MAKVLINVVTFIKHVDVAGLRSTRSKLFHKSVFLKFLPNQQKNTCARVFFLINLQTETASELC